MKYETGGAYAALPERETQLRDIHQGRRIVVCGAAGDLGRATAELLIAQGARVVAADVRADDAAEVARELGGEDRGVTSTALDLSDSDSIQRAVDYAATALGGIDGWANCAAIVLHCDPLNIPKEQWTRQFDVNLFGAYEAAVAAAKVMIGDGTRGAIVSVASEAGKKGHRDSLAYSASKAGVISMTRVLSEVLAEHDINVNCVCPGGMDSAMLRDVAATYAELTDSEPDDVYAQMMNAHLRRHVQPREVARVISFLLSDDALLIRGQAVNTDAGDTPQ